MDIQEKEAIEKQFERNLELLVREKFPLTATAIVSAEQPIILLFKELIHRIEKREYELDKKEKIINDMAREIYITAVKDNGQHFITEQEVIDHFTNKYEEGKG